jgi:uncharacterized protein with ATP-grasp and redox domains
MKLNLECIPCFQRQALSTIRLISDDADLQQNVLKEVIKELLKSDWHSTPPELAHKVHTLIKRITKETDPYKQVKKDSNDLVLKKYSVLKKKVENSKDPLETALRLAIAGNIIDYGIIEKFNLEGTIKEVLNKKFAIFDYTQFKDVLKNSKTLLYFIDNAGEIVIDKLLVETILKEKHLEKITFVVKGGPIINDATLEDARYIGLNLLPNTNFLVISNGEEGTGPERNSNEVKDWIKKHDIVISKGQGNYEGFSEFNGLFFMLMAKCPLVASDLEVNIGDIILKHKK